MDRYKWLDKEGRTALVERHPSSTGYVAVHAGGIQELCDTDPAGVLAWELLRLAEENTALREQYRWLKVRREEDTAELKVLRALLSDLKTNLAAIGARLDRHG